jgi:hypothetical protein
VLCIILAQEVDTIIIQGTEIKFIANETITTPTASSPYFTYCC